MHLLILDLDETLLHSSLPDEARDARLPSYEVLAYRTQFRPGLQRFLLASARDYQLAVWTAGGRAYAHAALEALAQHTRLRPAWAFVFTRERCTIASDPERAPLKDLKKAFRRGWRKERTLLLDDRPDSARRHRGNLLPIRAWTGDPHDRELERLLPDLQRLASAESVREVRAKRSLSSSRCGS